MAHSVVLSGKPIQINHYRCKERYTCSATDLHFNKIKCSPDKPSIDRHSWAITTMLHFILYKFI